MYEYLYLYYVFKKIDHLFYLKYFKNIEKLL
jgi:hypothetical protein